MTEILSGTVAYRKILKVCGKRYKTLQKALRKLSGETEDHSRAMEGNRNSSLIMEERQSTVHWISGWSQDWKKHLGL